MDIEVEFVVVVKMTEVNGSLIGKGQVVGESWMVVKSRQLLVLPNCDVTDF